MISRLREPVALRHLQLQSGTTPGANSELHSSLFSPLTRRYPISELAPFLGQLKGHALPLVEALGVGPSQRERQRCRRGRLQRDERIREPCHPEDPRSLSGRTTGFIRPGK